MCFPDAKQMLYVSKEKEELIDPSREKFPKRWPDNRAAVIIRIDGTNLLLMIRKMRSSRPHFKYIFHYRGADKQRRRSHRRQSLPTISPCLSPSLSRSLSSHTGKHGTSCLGHGAMSHFLVMLGLSQIESICFKAEGMEGRCKACHGSILFARKNPSRDSL